MVRFSLPQLKKTKVAEINTAVTDDLKPGNKKFAVKAGHIEIGGKRFWVRSSWEANICAYLEWLKNRGQILDWEYEKETFWFMKIMRGVRSYKPDFKITRLNGTFRRWEVKGYMDSKSATKLKRMKKYHPDIVIEVIDKDRYHEIAKGSALYPGWGQLS